MSSVERVLDGNNFDSIASHIKALREIGVHVQPRSDIEPKIIESVQGTAREGMSFLENILLLVKQAIGEKLLGHASELAKLRGESPEEYVVEFEKTLDHGELADFLRWVDEDNRQYGLFRAYPWIREPEIDLLVLEQYFDELFSNLMGDDDSKVFHSVFESYRRKYAELVATGSHAFWNTDLQFEFFCKFKPKYALYRFGDIISDAIARPFDEFIAFEVSADDCYFEISKNYFFSGIAGLKGHSKLDLCIFDGCNC